MNQVQGRSKMYVLKNNYKFLCNTLFVSVLDFPVFCILENIDGSKYIYIY